MKIDQHGKTMPVPTIHGKEFVFILLIYKIEKFYTEQIEVRDGEKHAKDMHTHIA